MMADLESQQATLKETLLRISGAIQVLQEIIASSTDDAEPPADAARAAPQADA